MLNPSVNLYIESIRDGRGDDYLLDVERNLVHLISNCSRGISNIHEFIEVLNLVSPEKLFNRISQHVNGMLAAMQEQKNDNGSLESLCNELDVCLYILFEINGKCLASFGQLLLRIEPIVVTMKPKLNLLSMGLRSSFLKGVSLVEAYPNLMQLLRFTNAQDKLIFELIFYALSSSRSDKSSRLINGIIKTTLSLKRNDVINLARDLRRSNVSLSFRSTGETEFFDHNHVLDQLNEAYRNNRFDPDMIYAQLLVLSYAGLVSRNILLWISAHRTQLHLEEFKMNLLLGLFGYDALITWSINKDYYLNNKLAGIEAPSQFSSLAKYFTSTLKKWSKQEDSSSNHGNTIPLVSVLMTTLNPDIELLGLSVRSVMQQTHTALQLIIIDDNSTPDISNKIKALVESCSKQYGKDIIYYKNAETLGQYVSRNIAIKLSKGLFITVQDDDDISHPSRVSLQLAKMQQDTELVAVQTLHLRLSKNARFLIDGNGFGELFGDSLVSFMWRSSVFDEIGMFSPLKSRGDVDFRTRLLHRYGDKRVCTINIPLVLMRGDFSTVSSVREYYYRTAVQTVRKVINISSTHSLPILEKVVPFNLL